MLRLLPLRGVSFGLRSGGWVRPRPLRLSPAFQVGVSWVSPGFGPVWGCFPVALGRPLGRPCLSPSWLFACRRPSGAVPCVASTPAWGFLMGSSLPLAFVAPSSSSSLAAGVPASFSVAPGSSPVPFSGFVPVCGGSAVRLSRLEPFRSRAGCVGVRVFWFCPVSGLSGSLVCLSRGFPGGEGSPAARAWLAALRLAVSFGWLVFLAGAPGGRGVCPGYFCAFSRSPFVAAPAPSADPFAGF